MGRQRKMAQLKEQIKTTEKELNEMEINDLLGADFKTLVIMIPKELIRYLNSIEKTQAEIKATLGVIKKNL